VTTYAARFHIIAWATRLHPAFCYLFVCSLLSRFFPLLFHTSLFLPKITNWCGVLTIVCCTWYVTARIRKQRTASSVQNVFVIPARSAGRTASSVQRLRHSYKFCRANGVLSSNTSSFLQILQSERRSQFKDFVFPTNSAERTAFSVQRLRHSYKFCRANGVLSSKTSSFPQVVQNISPPVTSNWPRQLPSMLFVAFHHSSFFILLLGLKVPPVCLEISHATQNTN
jgi:hypothetical protein